LSHKYVQNLIDHRRLAKGCVTAESLIASPHAVWNAGEKIKCSISSYEKFTAFLVSIGSV